MNTYYIYIMSSFTNSVLYIGVTNDIERRVYEHKNKTFEGFTKKYNVNKLVYYETYSDINEAIYREKQLKGKNRNYKINLIEKENPQWSDLSSNF
ncbi:MAG: GIY-YIG nuclease family protein [Clostridia bacterium]|nr:GIY-YIG nuclease family protein [Clostridia bacterium]